MTKASVATLVGLALTFALNACGPTYDCVTPCGASVAGTEDCTGAMRAEYISIDTYARVVGWAPRRMCSVLSGWLIAVRQDADVNGTFYVGPQRVYGVTFMDSALVQIGTDNWERSSLAHEYGHVWQWKIRGEGDFDHSSWGQLGIWDAIAEARASMLAGGWPR